LGQRKDLTRGFPNSLLFDINEYKGIDKKSRFLACQKASKIDKNFIFEAKKAIKKTAGF